MTGKDARRLGRMKAKAKKVLAKQKHPLKPKRRSNMHRKITKNRFLKALPGTGGLISLLCERLGCKRYTIHNILKRPGWQDVQQAYADEIEKVKDLAERTVIRSMDSEDEHLAFKSSTWYLERQARERGYASAKDVTIHGGSPIKVGVSLETLDLPLSVRLAVLDAMERNELAQNEQEVDIKMLPQVVSQVVSTPEVTEIQEDGNDELKQAAVATPAKGRRRKNDANGRT